MKEKVSTTIEDAPFFKTGWRGRDFGDYHIGCMYGVELVVCERKVFVGWLTT